MDILSTDDIPFIRNCRILNWILCGFALISSICRADWNVVFAFFGLAILIKFYERNPKYFTGLLFVMYSISCIMDIIWMILVLPNYDENESSSPSWKKLSFVHSLTTFCSVFEIIIKGFLLFLLFRKGALQDFKFINDGIQMFK